jgi:hypothetical protein
MIPSVSRNVHYVSYGTPGGEYASACRAAIVTEAVPVARGSWEESRASEVSLFVMSPAGLFFPRNVLFDAGSDQAPVPVTAFDAVPEPLCGGRWYAGGTWHWPARVPE